MPGFLLDKSATVMCVHGGQAEPAVPNPAVTLDGMRTLLLTSAEPKLSLRCMSDALSRS
jgi:hypothetical protein